jgi:hypothetical protein
MSMSRRHKKGVEVQTYLFLTSALGEMSGQLHSRPPSDRKKPQNPLNRRHSGLQSQSGCFGEEKNLLIMPGFEPWIIQPTV